jgi:hypothetical protein
MLRNVAHATTVPCRLRGFKTAVRARVSDDRYGRADVASTISLWGPAFVFVCVCVCVIESCMKNTSDVWVGSEAQCGFRFSTAPMYVVVSHSGSDISFQFTVLLGEVAVRWWGGRSAEEFT